MKHLENLDLRFAVEIDQQVAAADQVEARERRVAQDVVMREQHVLAQFLLDAIVRGVFRKELAHAVGRDIAQDCIGIEAGAREGDCPLVDVGGENLEGGALGRLERALLQQHRQRIGLLAGRAAHRPHADAVLFAAPFEYRRQHVALQHVERFLVAEEVRHADQHVLQQRLGFVRMQVEIVAVRLEIGDAVDLQAALDPAHDGRALVMAEIVCRARAQDHHDLAQRTLGGLVGESLLALAFLRIRKMNLFRGQPQIEQPLRHLRGGEHEIDHARGNRAARHAVVLRFGGILRERDAAHFLDARETRGAVRTRAGKHDADRSFAMGLRERAEEHVDGGPAPLFGFALLDPQIIVDHRQVERRCNHVDMIGFDGGGPRERQHRHGGHLLQQLRQIAGMVARQMNHDHERHRGMCGQGFEKLQKRTQPAG